MTPLAKRLGIALFVSVALNLLCAGFLFGRGLRGRPHPPRDFPGAEWGMPRHPAMRGALEGRRGELREQRRAGEAARTAVKEALRREPFERAALDGALAALRKQTGHGQEIVHRALADAAAKGDAAQRQALAQAFDAGPGRGRRR